MGHWLFFKTVSSIGRYMGQTFRKSYNFQIPKTKDIIEIPGGLYLEFQMMIITIYLVLLVARSNDSYSIVF